MYPTEVLTSVEDACVVVAFRVRPGSRLGKREVNDCRHDLTR